MRKKKDVQRELVQQLENVRALKDNQEKQEEYRSALESVQSLTEELNGINVAESAERALAANTLDKETEQAARRFSFTKFFRELGQENNAILTGVEAEMAALAVEEASRSGVLLKGTGIPLAVLNVRAFDGMTATGTPADGGMTIATQLRYQEALRNKLVLAKMGATVMGGLVGNINMIEGQAVTASWEGENTTVADSKKKFTSRSISPKRVALSVPVSKQLIVQSSWDVEALVLETIIAAHAEALEDAAINGSGTGQPLGILNTTGIGAVTIGANGGLVTFGKLVDLETAIAVKSADVSKMGYLTTPQVRGYSKQTLRNANVSGYIWGDTGLNGYPAYVSNIVPSNLTKGTGTGLSAALFGNFADLLLCQWGGLDIVVDPYTLKKEAALEITLNAYHDIFLRRKESFAAIKDIAIQ